MLTECAHCHEPVDLMYGLRDLSTLTPLARRGVLEAIAQWGVLCDTCYTRQEAVR